MNLLYVIIIELTFNNLRVLLSNRYSQFDNRKYLSFSKTLHLLTYSILRQFF